MKSTPKKRFYYDITIPNNVFVNPSQIPIPAKFSETRDSPLFDDHPDKFNLSVVRFTVPTASIPYQYVSTMHDVSNPLNPNKMSFSVSLRYLGITYREYLQWETQATFAPIPAPPPIGPDTRFRGPLFYYYYALYSLNHFCDLINKAFARCFNNNILPLLPPPVPPLVYQTPYMTYDGATNLFTLHVSGLFVGQVPTIAAGWDYLLDTCFNTSWNTVGESINNLLGLDIRLVFIPNLGESTPDLTDPSGLSYAYRQEFDTTGNISKFQSLLFVSPSLPVNTDIISNTSVVQGPPSAGANFGSVAGGFIPLITDFEIDQSSVKNLHGVIHYIPSAEYRRLTMRGKHPVTQIDIDVFWKDVYGNVFPVLIQTNSAITIKILFEEQ